MKKLKPRGELIKSIRESKGPTQKDLSRALIITTRQIRKFESSTPVKAMNVNYLALYFGVHIDVITNYTNLN